jgi:hypothetical protein
MRKTAPDFINGKNYFIIVNLLLCISRADDMQEASQIVVLKYIVKGFEI